MTEIGEWIKEVEIDALPKQHREIADVIGVEAAVKLSDKFGGMPVYIPKIDSLLERERNKLIRRDAKVMGYRDLVKKYRLSEVWIRQIVDHQQQEDKQQDLFD